MRWKGETSMRWEGKKRRCPSGNVLERARDQNAVGLADEGEQSVAFAARVQSRVVRRLRAEDCGGLKGEHKASIAVIKLRLS